MIKAMYLEMKLNEGLKSKVVVCSFRVSAWVIASTWKKVLFFPALLFHKIIVDVFWGVEIPPNCTIGFGLKISHAKCITIHPKVTAGTGLHLRHGVTIGNKRSGSSSVPIIGNNVEFGCFSTVLGGLEVGDDSILGAHVLVVDSIPKRSVVKCIQGRV